MQHIHRYLKKDPSYNDIRSVFAGLRPLVKSNSKITSAISRDHHISVSDSELSVLPVANGPLIAKWRKM